MPQQVTLLKVFLSSPSDVAYERSVLAEVIQELNITWAAALNIQLQLLHWQTHSHPALGLDPQSIINRQIGDDYDIFIGVMWVRFGSPTRRAGSGTEEEFRRAVAREKANSGSVKILFYFKNDPIPPTDIDPEQLSKVFTFKGDLATSGALYSEFTGDFADHVRLHLSREIIEFVKTLNHPTDKTNTANNAPAIRPDPRMP